MPRCMKLLILVGSLMAVTSASWAAAFNLGDYVPGGTPVVFKFVNYDVGTLYSIDPALDPITYSGATTLNGLAQAAPSKALTGEDAWGIFKLTEIDSSNQSHQYWNAATAPEQITGIFWGETDTYIAQTGSGSGLTQDIHGTGMQFAFFTNTTKNFDANSVLGPTARFNVGAQPNYTGVTDGDLWLTGFSIPGWDTAYPSDEFFGTFRPNALPGDFSGNGGAFADLGNVSGWGTGPGNGQIGQYAPGIGFRMDFTGNRGFNGWEVQSNDPLKTGTSPELSSSTLMLLGFIPMGLGWWRRRKA